MVRGLGFRVWNLGWRVLTLAGGCKYSGKRVFTSCSSGSAAAAAAAAPAKVAPAAAISAFRTGRPHVCLVRSRKGDRQQIPSDLGLSFYAMRRCRGVQAHTLRLSRLHRILAKPSAESDCARAGAASRQRKEEEEEGWEEGDAHWGGHVGSWNESGIMQKGFFGSSRFAAAAA